jgi:hypothetical protein
LLIEQVKQTAKDFITKISDGAAQRATSGFFNMYVRLLTTCQSLFFAVQTVWLYIHLCLTDIARDELLYKDSYDLNISHADSPCIALPFLWIQRKGRAIQGLSA